MLKALALSFLEFLKDIATSWIGAMSGILSVCLWAYGAFVEPEPVSLRATFLILAFVALLIACFTGWLKRMPRLVGDIDQIILGVPRGDDQSSTTIITMSIRNTGHPSVADKWSIYAILADGRRVDGIKILISETHLFAESGSFSVPITGQTTSQPTLRITEADALYRKAMTPIPTGGMIRGYLIASFRGVPQSQMRLAGTKIVVDFFDVWDRNYPITYVIASGGLPLAQAGVFPTG